MKAPLVSRHFRVSSLFLLGTLLSIVSCAPEQPGTADQVAVNQSSATQLDQINTEVNDLQAAANSDYPDDETAIANRIASNEAMISSMGAESNIQRATYADELQAIRFRQSQEANLTQQILVNLSEQIRRQEGMVANAYQAVIALPDSDARTQAEATHQAALNDLSALQTAYANTLNVQQSSPDSYFAEQSQRIEQVKADQAQLASLIQSAQQENISLRQQQAERMKMKATRGARIQTLRAEQAKLSTPNATQTQTQVQ